MSIRPAYLLALDNGNDLESIMDNQELKNGFHLYYFIADYYLPQKSSGSYRMCRIRDHTDRIFPWRKMDRGSNAIKKPSIGG